MGLYVPMVNPAFWQKLGGKLQETATKLWADNIAGYRANTAKSQENGRAALEKQGVVFVDVPQAELDKIHAEYVKVQDKAVAEAHISPKLVELIMADLEA
jgi:TRAP-type C4-dicarboxylate transport system substrate-binding protein